MLDLLRVSELATELGVPEATLRWWRHIGSGPPSFRIGRRVVYKRSEVETWVEGCAASERSARYDEREGAAERSWKRR